MFNKHRGRLSGTIGLALSTILGLALILATGPVNTLAGLLAPSGQGQALKSRNDRSRCDSRSHRQGFLSGLRETLPD